jgi:hypothetical protein
MRINIGVHLSISLELVTWRLQIAFFKGQTLGSRVCSWVHHLWKARTGRESKFRLRCGLHEDLGKCVGSSAAGMMRPCRWKKGAGMP